MTARCSIVVSFDLPKGTGIDEAKAYVLDALASTGLGYRPPRTLDEDDPGDPYFGGPKNVTVTTNGRKWPTKENSP